MNTTQYYKHENFLVVQNGDYNDTFDLSKDYVNEFINVADYLATKKTKFALDLGLRRVAMVLQGRFDNLFKERYGYIECIIPNPKVTIQYGDDFTKELKSRFAFFLNNRFVFAFYSDWAC